MTPTRSALNLLSDHLAQLSRRAEGQAALERFARAGLDTERAEDVATLVRRCHGPCADGLRASLLGALVPLAAGDEAAAVCVLVALRPELVRMVRLLARGPVDYEDAEAEMIAIAWGVVTGFAGKDRGPSGADRMMDDRLVDAIWTEARRAGGLRRKGLIEVVARPESLDIVTPEADPLERWPGLLAAAVAARVLTPRQVVLIARTRGEGRPLTEVARALHRPWGTAYQERRRGEEALRAFARDYVAGEDR